MEHVKMPIGNLNEPVNGRPCTLLFDKVPRSTSTSNGSSNHQVLALVDCKILTAVSLANPIAGVCQLPL